MSVLSELRRRNVFRVAALYLVAGWVLLQVADLLFGALGVPQWGLRFVLGLLLLGFPLVVIFSWVYELTPEGLKREHEVDRHASISHETGRRINLLIAVLLAIAIGIGGFGLLRERRAPGTDAGAAEPARPPAASAPGLAMAASIAVLPFVNMSEDRNNEYFSDGLTEELLNLLAKVPELKVIARTSSFAYKGKEAKISDIARELQVAHVLEGSVRRSGDRVRITAQLIRASDSTHLWSETYDRTISDIFAVQDEIAGQVVGSLKLKLLGDAKPHEQAGGTRDAAAYEAFLRGRYEWNKGTTETSLRAALAELDRAVALDPAFADAHALRAIVQLRLASNGYVRFSDGVAAARAAAEEAIRLAPDAPGGHVALASLYATAMRNWPGAQASVRRALELNPSDADAMVVQSNLYSFVGRYDDAIAAARQAQALDPLSANRMLALATIYFAARRYDEAQVAARQGLALDPQRPTLHAVLGRLALVRGDATAALAECNQEPIVWQRQTCLVLAYDKLGRAAEAEAQFKELRKDGDISAFQYAEIHAQRGEIDQALHWLEVARRVDDPGLSQAGFAVTLDPLRKDPRFVALLREFGYPTG